MTGTETYQRQSDGWHSLPTGSVVAFGIPDPPPTNPTKLVGVYQAGNNTTSVNGTLPRAYCVGMNVAAFYLNWATTPASQGMANFSGMDLLKVTMSPGAATTYGAIISGAQDSTIITRIAQLDAIGPKVHLSLTCEPDNATASTRPSDTSAANYVAAANHFADLVTAHTTNGIENDVHLASFGGDSVVGPFLPNVTKFQNVSWDPYKTGTHSSSETCSGTWGSFITSTLVPRGWTTDKVDYHITETGSVYNGSFTDAQTIAWYNTWSAAMDNLQIKSAIYFRDNAAKIWIITDTATDNAVSAILSAIV